MTVDPQWIIEMAPATLTEWMPGTEEMPEGERYYATARRFTLVGRTAYNTSLIVGDGSHSLAALKAGIIDFKLPGKDDQGRIVTLKHSTEAGDEAVFQSLPPAVSNWLWDLVSRLNPLFPELSEEQAEEARADLAEEREELQELQQMEASPEVDEEDPLAGCAGSPGSATADEAAATPGASTRSKRRT